MSYRGVITPAKLRLTTHPFSFSYNFSHCLRAQSIASVPRFPKLAPVMPLAINTNIIAETSSNMISTHEKLVLEYKVTGIVFRGGYIILNILLHCNSAFAGLNKHLSQARSGFLPPEKAATKRRRAAPRVSGQACYYSLNCDADGHGACSPAIARSRLEICKAFKCARMCARSG